MEKIDKKRYDIVAFEELLIAQISLLYPDKSIVNQKKDQLALMLEKEEIRLTARSFFMIIHALDLDLSVVCYEFFKDLPSTRLQTFGNALEILFGIFLNSKSDVANATGLSEASINDLFNRSYDQFYAYEICSFAIAFGLVPSTLFEYFYNDQNKKMVLKLELVDGISREPDELLVVDQVFPTSIACKDDKTTSTLRKHQSKTFDYLVKHTDYFSTPRTPKGIIEDIKMRYHMSISIGNIYAFLKKYTDDELAKIKAVEYTAWGALSKKPKISYLKMSPQQAKSKNAVDKVTLKRIKNSDAGRFEVHDQQAQIKDPLPLDQLYKLISDHPGQRIPFYLNVFDIKAKVLESKLQKLQEEGKIEYRGTRKTGGYWDVTKNDSETMELTQ
ncbi:hypothetical protein GEO21_04365 [Sphingobacterium faecium]|uniref:hypothetical protein n=1 Tax=Sphingobacterium faecium TaxID=34087 RepID=UPI0012908B4C|nr:hypothetical protein [Sphingobacterium faecium]MQP26753.1 hypothetical protein [Sphingobacterium faecium]